MTADHREAILDQFTRQAVPFSTAPGIKNEQMLSTLVEASGAGPTDTVLDVACGTGNGLYLLKNRPQLDGKPTVYVCENYVCKAPVTRPEELRPLLQN